MSDQSYPPPGWSPPPPGPPTMAPGHPTPLPPGWSPAPAPRLAAHKPGAVPLRPLQLGDLFDAAFRIIRFNPRATVGAAVLVSSVAMLVPVAVTALVSFTIGAGVDTTSTGDLTSDDGVGIVVSFATIGLGVLFLQVGLILVTAMITRVTNAAAVGRRMGLGEAWDGLRGRRRHLVGLMLLEAAGYLGLLVVAGALVLGTALATDSALATVLVALIAGVVFVAAGAVLRIRVFYLSSPALVTEGIGVLASVRRAIGLSRRQFWRILGLALLTGLVAGVAGSLLSVPVTVAGEVVAALVPHYAGLTLAVMYAVSTVVSSAFTAPFSSAVASLQYLDQRMRKEAYDVELMSQAGLLGP